MITTRHLLALATVAQAAVAQSAVPSATEAPLEIPSEAPETVDEAMRIMRAGANPRFPYADDTSEACTYWHDDLGQLSCEEIADYYFLLPEEWNHWNPSVKADCSGWVPGNSYCIAAFADMPGSEPEPQTTTAAQTTTTTTQTTTTTTQTTTTTTQTTTTTTQTTTTAPTTTPAVPPTTTTTPGNGIQTPSPIQEGMVDNCNKFALIANNDDCRTLAAAHGITVEQVIAWNPAVGPGCGNLWGSTYACVGIIGGSTNPPPSTTTTTKPSNGIETPSPLQQEIVGNCNKFNFVNEGDNCEGVARRNGITVQQLQTWNPSVGSSCAGLWANAYACVGVIGFTPTPVQPGNGIATPTPLQREIVGNCNKFDWVNDNENCDTLARRNGITTQQFQAWNPSVGANCAGLWAKAYACVSVIGFTPTPVQPGNGVQTPQPTQQRMVDNCNKFDWVRDGENCDIVARRNGITTQQFQAWNPSVGSSCGGLWANAYACVGLIRGLRRWQG